MPPRKVRPTPPPHLLPFTQYSMEWSELPPLDENSSVCYHGVSTFTDATKLQPITVVVDGDAFDSFRGGCVSTSPVGVVVACAHQEEVSATRSRLESLARVFGSQAVEALLLTDRPRPTSEEAIKLWKRKVGPLNEADTSETPSEKIMLMLCGLPCSGKSTLSQHFLVPAGYVRVCQDVLKSKERTLREVERLLEEGRSVVLDRTNTDKAQRAPFISLAKRFNAKVCVCVLDTEREICRARLKSREVHEGKPLTANQRNSLLIGLGMMTKRWESPTLEEGIDEIRVASTVDEVRLLGEHYRAALGKVNEEEPQAKRCKVLDNYIWRRCVKFNSVYRRVFRSEQNIIYSSSNRCCSGSTANREFQ